MSRTRAALSVARVGVPHCTNCGRPISRQTVQQIVDRVFSFPTGSKLHILAPLVSSRKGEYKKIFDQIRKDGFVRVRVDGELKELDDDINLEKNKKQISELIESKKKDTKLLVVNNLTKFLKESKNKNNAANMLKEALGIFCRICARNKIALICTGDANVTSRGIIPRPIGGTFLKHTLNIIVHLRESSTSYSLAFKATLIKHQYVKTPTSVMVNTTKTGHLLLFDRS